MAAVFNYYSRFHHWRCSAPDPDWMPVSGDHPVPRKLRQRSDLDAALARPAISVELKPGGLAFLGDAPVTTDKPFAVAVPSRPSIELNDDEVAVIAALPVTHLALPRTRQSGLVVAALDHPERVVGLDVSGPFGPDELELSALSHLRELHADHVSAAVRAGLRAAIVSNPGLEVLTLRGGELTALFATLLAGLPSLRHLDLGDAAIEPADLAPLAGAASSLATVVLRPDVAARAREVLPWHVEIATAAPEILPAP